ncbi:hypothetical protein MAR_026037 [Mya arenaria]|uniref:Uncharacterized protein n=1 Tax=Mya arenaria TaxID=6604 RepID=A0ABY7EPD9_MYAAR|nr:hypothetical protein MAR_026037 [Mya arenaria]
MHLILNLATEVMKSLKMYERIIVAEGKIPYSMNSAECGTTRLVRTASKPLSSKGCERSGVSSKRNNLNYRGPRYNHILCAAGATCHHLEDMSNFLEEWSNRNGLLKSILFDFQESVYLGAIWALGIIDKLIRGPLWRLIESVRNPL